MRSIAWIAGPLAVLALMVVTAPGCGDDSGPAAFNPNLPGREGGASSGGTGNDTICLLNNCHTDQDCTDCTGGNTTCLQNEHRCIGCGANANGKSCGSGQTCTKYGNCVANGVTCAEDGQGVPTIKCKNTADCGACGPKFRVCDEAAGKCVGCSQSNTTNCQSTDFCSPTGTCTPKCPSQCNTDDDCGQCGSTAKPAGACNRHVCSQCSATKPCASGQCDLLHGTCVATCGKGRPGVSNCATDGDCAGCTGSTAADADVGKTCKLPINHAGDEPDGVCAVKATGCSDLGKGVIVLPDPFSRATQACSGDPDCANQSIDIDVGKLLRDATGLSLIKDANISYAMHACASIEVQDKSCGLCVPCKVDNDCSDIDIDKLAGDAFGPLGSVAAKLLLDKAFGPSDHKVHMFCQNVAGDYGVCLPCGNILSACGDKTESDNPQATTCDHDACATDNPDVDNKPLSPTCGAPSTCVADVCKKDPYCCTTAWDDACRTDVDLYCTDKTCQPNNCIYRPAGWFCNTDPTLGGYKCLGDGKDPDGTTADGQQCQTGRKCTTDKPGVKEPAVLCTVNNTDECPGDNAIGRPKCVTQ
jgi:hypothetical protein